MAMLFRELFIKFCRFGNDVASDDAFHVTMWVSGLVFVLRRVSGAIVARRGGGCEYSLMFSKHRSASVIHLFGRKGNLFFRMVGVGVVSWVWMNSYISVCMEFFGSSIC